MLRLFGGLLAVLLPICAAAQPPASPPPAAAAPAAAPPEEPWLLTRDVALVSRWPRGARMQEDAIAADLYRPRGEGRVPAAVIINSSGGVTAHTEINYARILAANGVAALVVDSFAPRFVRRTGDDQNRVLQIASNGDAVAGVRWLAAQTWVDPERIVVMGMSRGGEAALATALEVVRRRLQASDIRVAAHVAISPGGCSLQQRDARTTGTPIFFMLSELDDGTPAMPCVEYIQRMRAAGNANVRWAVYPGVYHAQENTGGIAAVPDDWTSRSCVGRLWRDDNGVIIERASGEPVTRGNVTQWLFRTCMETGYTVGGDERVKAQAIADLLQFLRDVDVLRDAQARAIVPDCGTLPPGMVKRNCERARNGWTADLVALGRAFRRGVVVTRNDALAARLFTLAAERRNPQAQWELALMLRQGAGVAQDPARALALARAAAEAGDGPGSNVYGVMIRDGIGGARDDAAATLWFRRAADLRSSYGMMNLGRMMWDGRGGEARDRAAAVALWRRAIYQDGNPWAQLLLAAALEAGDGAPADATAARALYQAAADQTREPVVRRRASDALARLGPQ